MPTVLMRSALAISVIAASSYHVRLAGAQATTGVVTFRVNHAGAPSETITQSIKGNRMRLDMSREGSSADKQGAMIMDNDAHTTTVIIPERKQYMVMSANDVTGMGPMRPRPVPSSSMMPADLKIEKTGRTEVVAGVKCDVYHGSSMKNGKKEEGEVCVADGVGFAILQMANGGMMGGAARSIPQMDQFRDLLKGGRGILKITQIVDGKPVVQLEAIKIDRSAPSDAVFAPPSDYTKFDPSSMMRNRPPRPKP
ncbi:MAG: DUF4412 domain-containing protein [Gemmatimonadota bacterium]|nr:DUF4412 domain-containing protein [Gemmatimonadota bacterium]